MPTRSRITRGKTQPGRLRRLDAFLCAQERGLLTRSDAGLRDAVFVDVGFGQSLVTTEESVEAFRHVGFEGRTIAVDTDAGRVAIARERCPHGVEVRQGGFDLPLHEAERARLIRAMNVLRQYREREAWDACERMGASLAVGGLLVEGTSSKHGSLLTAHLLRRTGDGLTREGLLFSTTFARGFAPIQMRDHLPRDLRRRVVPGAPITEFFGAWTAAWQSARADGFVHPPLAFAEAGRRLAQRVEGIDTDEAMLADGYLLWRPALGVPI